MGIMSWNKRDSERIVLIIVSIATIALMVASLRFERQMNNQKLLYYQLQAIRTSVNLFKAITKKNPKTLLELATAEYHFPEEEQRHKYLENAPLDGEGGLADPFGKPYMYDPRSGWVRSSSPGYELW